MNDTSRGSPSRDSPAGRSLIFDPFLLKADHYQHSDSTDIIRMEQSGKIFCPICLDNTPAGEIYSLEQGAFDHYVRNLFDAIDQYSETIRLRRIILPILGIILEKRDYKASNDYELHRIIRVLYKCLKSDGFSGQEFPAVSSIFWSVTTSYDPARPLPLNTIWNAANHLLKNGKSLLSGAENNQNSNRLEILGGLANIIRAYFNALDRFESNRNSEFIFQIRTTDTPHYRRHSRDSQIECIHFMSRTIIPESKSFFDGGEIRSRKGRIAVGNIFEALRDCLHPNGRPSYRVLHGCLVSIDILKLAHKVVKKVKDNNLRGKIKPFIKRFVANQIERDLGTDEKFESVVSSETMIEINHKSVIKSCNQPTCDSSVVFYILLNYVASQLGSRYFNEQEVRSVLHHIDPVLLKIYESQVTLKAYNHILATTLSSVDDIPYLRDSFRNILQILTRRSYGYETFNESFCFDSGVFFLFFQYQEFIEMVNIDTFKRLFERNLKVEKLRHDLNLLLRNDLYKGRLIEYVLESDESTTTLVRALSLKDRSRDQAVNDPNDTFQDTFEECIEDNLTYEFGAVLTALIHEYVRDAIGQTINESRLVKLVDIATNLIRECEEFKLTLDRRFIFDFSLLMESLYKEHLSGRKYADILIAFNQLVTQLILTTPEWLLTILEHLNPATLGYMNQCLSDYTCGDMLGESIAELFVAYDGISYPLRHHISQNLYQMSDSVFHWMLSENKNLHHLSMLAIQRTLKNRDAGNSTKVLLSTGFIHMIYANKSLLDNQLYIQMFESLLQYEELLYNPLLSRILTLLPEYIKEKLEPGFERCETPAPEVVLLFDSSESSDADSDIINIDEVLAQIHEESGDCTGNHNQTPGFGFACNGSQRLSSQVPNIEEWERFAHATHKQIKGG